MPGLVPGILGLGGKSRGLIGLPGQAGNDEKEKQESLPWG
jgi:hypothetical protein